VLDEAEQPLLAGRFGTDREGYRLLLAAGRRFGQRLWAVEGCRGVGRHLAQRLVADGETVLGVPAKLSARARVFSTGQGRKTDATDAHSVAVVALRTRSLRPVRPDDRTVALRLLADRRDELGAARTLTINRLRRLLVELVPGGAKKALTARQAALCSMPCLPGMSSQRPGLHIMAIVQLRHDTDGRRYYDRRVAEGKTPIEAMRALKRRLSDVVYHPARRRPEAPAAERARAGPEGHMGATTRSGAAGSNPNTGAPDKSQPAPVTVSSAWTAARAAPSRRTDVPRRRPFGMLSLLL
jgi:Transposase